MVRRERLVRIGAQLNSAWRRLAISSSVSSFGSPSSDFWDVFSEALGVLGLGLGLGLLGLGDLARSEPSSDLSFLTFGGDAGRNGSSNSRFRFEGWRPVANAAAAARSVVDAKVLVYLFPRVELPAFSLELVVGDSA